MKRPRFPHPVVLLVGCVTIAAVATFVVPAGEYDRALDPATGREVVVAGTYQQTESNPVGLFAAMVALPRGMADAADVVFLIFLVGGAFTVVDATGALRRGIGWLCERLAGARSLILVAVSLVFATGGALENMQEEIIALIPMLLVLTRRLALPPLAAVAISAGPAFVGSAFSPINPFQVGIAQKIAELPLLSGGGFRLVFLGLALLLWIATSLRWLARHREQPTAGDGAVGGEPLRPRDTAILGLVGITFVVMVVGLVRAGWGFDELSGLFFVMGAIAGLLGGLGVEGTAKAYVVGFRDMASAALLVGFARAVYVVLQDGRIIDTLVHGLFVPIADLPIGLFAVAMMAAHTAIHVPVPSVSGHAVLTLPVLVPVADLLGMSRQVVVLAYQMGAGLCDMVTPTNGSLLAILAAARVRYEDWLRFVWRRYLLLAALGVVMIATALLVDLQ